MRGLWNLGHSCSDLSSEVMVTSIWCEAHWDILNGANKYSDPIVQQKDSYWFFITF